MSFGTVLKYTYNQNKGVKLTILSMGFLTGDNKGHTFQISVVDNKGPVDLSGAGVTGWFIPNDKNLVDDLSVPLVGSVFENVAIVSLPPEAYIETGRFSIVIKLHHNESVSTIFWGAGNVTRSNTDSQVDIGGVIPSLDDLLAQIARLESAIEDANEATENANSAASHAPYIDASTNNWFVWDAVNSMYVDTGVRATGPQGPAGANGTGSGTVVSVTVNGQTYEADETGDVDLGTIAGGAGGGVSSVTINGDTFTPDANGNVAATISQIRRGVVYAQPYNNTAVSEYGLQMIDNQDKKSLYLISELNTPDVLHYQASGGSRRALYSEGNPPPYPVKSATMNGESFTPDENGNIDFGTISGGSGGSGGTAADSEKLGGKEPKYYLQPENKLINSFFKNPVNTQGKTSYTEKGKDSINEWSIDSLNMTVDLSDNGISISFTSETGSGVVLQTIDLLPDGDYTGAICVDGKVYTSNTTCTNGQLAKGNNAIFDDSVGYFRIGYNLNYGKNEFPIFVYPKKTVPNIEWAALYPGTFTVDNLPPYVPKGYAAELLACSIADTGRVHDSDKLGGQAPSYYENKVTSVNGSTGAVTVSQIKRGVTNLQPYNNNAVTEYGLQAYNSQTGKSLYMIIRDAAPNTLRIISANTSQDIFSTLNPPIKTADVTFAYNGESAVHYAKVSGVTSLSQIINIMTTGVDGYVCNIGYSSSLGVFAQIYNSDGFIVTTSQVLHVVYMV